MALSGSAPFADREEETENQRHLHQGERRKVRPSQPKGGEG